MYDEPLYVNIQLISGRNGHPLPGYKAFIIIEYTWLFASYGDMHSC